MVLRVSHRMFLTQPVLERDLGLRATRARVYKGGHEGEGQYCH